MKEAKTANLLSAAPLINGGLTAKTRDVFVTDQRDILVGDGDATFTPIITGLGTTSPNIQDVLSIKITGGTGRYANATGSLKVQGLGRDVGPGSGVFILEYTGSVCLTASTLRPAAAESNDR